MRRRSARAGRRLLPAVRSDESHRVTKLELFFDLAYVFAFTQLTHLMAHRHDALGILQALVILTLLWWSWTAYAWLTNHAHADEGVVGIAIVVAMTAMFVSGLVVPQAYDDHDGGLSAPLVFVAAYLAARVTHAIVYLLAGVEDRSMRRGVVGTVVLSLVPAGTLLTAGAALGQPWQLRCWVAAVVIEGLVAYLLRRSVDWRVRSPAHFAERYGLVVILALGESIIAIGFGADLASEPINAHTLVGVVLAILISVGMWSAYFGRLADLAERALTHARGAQRARIARDGYTYLHLMLITGIVVAAVGMEQAMTRIAEDRSFGFFGALALGAGTASYLTATGLVAHATLHRWWQTRFAGAILLLGAVVGLARLPPIAALATVAVLLLMVPNVERRWRYCAGTPEHPCPPSTAEAQRLRRRTPVR